MKKQVLISMLVLGTTALLPAATFAHSPKMPAPRMSPSKSKKAPLKLQPVGSRKRNRANPMPASPLLLSLLSLNGCADNLKAGATCPDIDFTPSGAPPYENSVFDTIRAECRLDQVTSWGSLAEGPSLSSSCEQAILDALPLELSFATGTVGKGVSARSNLARAFHALLFMPLADTGDIFSSTDDTDYCPDIYRNFLFAPTQTLEPQVMTTAEYDSGFSQMNVELARFILERMGEFRYETGDGTYEGREDNGDIHLTDEFADNSNYLLTAAVVLHEARHNATGFPDGSDHVKCQQGLYKGDADCDDSMFGAYGSQIAYLDAVLKGSAVTTLEDGTPLLDQNGFSSAVYMACTLYQEAINEPQGALVELFQGVDCGDIDDDSVEFAESIFGIPADQVQLR